MMTRFLYHILFILLFQPAEEYPLKNGRPTSKGIEQYIEEMSDSLVYEYQQFIGDTIYNIWIYAEDLEEYDLADSIELGRYYPNEIYITTEELFIAYELDDLKRVTRASIDQSNRFVKSTVFHELTHEYIHQISQEMQFVEGIGVHRAYQTYIWFLRTYETFGSEFIEEGICEYVTTKMGEVIPPRRIPVPRNVEELTSRENRYWITYKYAAEYVKELLDITGLKEGIRILLYNPPPNFEEILEPELFFSRLVRPPGQS